MRKYTIKSGDSWWKIANENGMTVEELKNLNPEIKMHPGQILSLKKSV